MQTDIRLREFRIKFQLKRDADGRPVPVRTYLRTAADSATILVPLLQDEPVEVFAILCLNTKGRVIAYHEVSRGTLDMALAHPRDVFRAALLANAASIILAHNHPSGDPLPSPDDVRLTRRLTAAGYVLGIDVQDHVIVGDQRHFSFRDAGVLDQPAT